MGIRMNTISFPAKIAALISGETYQTDEIGMSDASVLLFEDKVLKIQESNEEAFNEYRMLTWLGGKLPVPKVFAIVLDSYKQFSHHRRHFAQQYRRIIGQNKNRYNQTQI